jgi:short-subunit dehydrogenase
VLVNNAGVLASGHFEAIDHDAYERIIQVNVQGLTNVAQLAFEWLQKTPDSTLVNMCSVSSVHGIPQLAVYSASKFYVNGLSQALSIEWAEHGIRVLTIKPPFVKTGMVENLPEQLMEKFTVDLVPEQIADVVMSALNGSGQSYIVSMKAKVWAVLMKLLPGRLGRGLAKSLTGY